MSSDGVKLNNQEEKIAEELDLKAILAYEERLKNNEVEYIPFEEIRKNLGL